MNFFFFFLNYRKTSFPTRKASPPLVQTNNVNKTFRVYLQKQVFFRFQASTDIISFHISLYSVYHYLRICSTFTLITQPLYPVSLSILSLGQIILKDGGFTFSFSQKWWISRLIYIYFSSDTASFQILSWDHDGEGRRARFGVTGEAEPNRLHASTNITHLVCQLLMIQIRHQIGFITF